MKCKITKHPKFIKKKKKKQQQQRKFPLPGPTMQDLTKSKAQQDPRSSSLTLGKGQECGQRLKGEGGGKP